ncbi:ribonuclease E [Gloeobacter kilaueensis]|uniref:Ribonuclease E n=1 Tax=Gloeobacter kilaueensis (strain ATCC BAA-2537 / CCAP 1431/1 / ULC 316 / JS1) TaxID=1183438 RepID=U5QJ34_GLOK1|nr:ribonuclease E [Gloeobacter kilaueensis]AGY58921.1 ribonuclease E [Gloeobacter kilaueensis JS1]
MEPQLPSGVPPLGEADLRRPLPPLGQDILLPQPFLAPAAAEPLTAVDPLAFFPEGLPGYEPPVNPFQESPFFFAPQEPVVEPQPRLDPGELSLEEAMAAEATPRNNRDRQPEERRRQLDDDLDNPLRLDEGRELPDEQQQILSREEDPADAPLSLEEHFAEDGPPGEAEEQELQELEQEAAESSAPLETELEAESPLDAAEVAEDESRFADDASQATGELEESDPDGQGEREGFSSPESSADSVSGSLPSSEQLFAESGVTAPAPSYPEASTTPVAESTAPSIPADVTGTLADPNLLAREALPPLADSALPVESIPAEQNVASSANLSEATSSFASLEEQFAQEAPSRPATDRRAGLDSAQPPASSQTQARSAATSPVPPVGADLAALAGLEAQERLSRPADTGTSLPQPTESAPQPVAAEQPAVAQPEAVVGESLPQLQSAPEQPASLPEASEQIAADLGSTSGDPLTAGLESTATESTGQPDELAQQLQPAPLEEDSPSVPFTDDSFAEAELPAQTAEEPLVDPEETGRFDEWPVAEPQPLEPTLDPLQQAEPERSELETLPEAEQEAVSGAGEGPSALDEAIVEQELRNAPEPLLAPDAFTTAPDQAASAGELPEPAFTPQPPQSDLQGAAATPGESTGLPSVPASEFASLEEQFMEESPAAPGLSPAFPQAQAESAQAQAVDAAREADVPQAAQQLPDESFQAPVPPQTLQPPLADESATTFTGAPAQETAQEASFFDPAESAAASSTQAEHPDLPFATSEAATEAEQTAASPPEVVSESGQQSGFSRVEAQTPALEPFSETTTVPAYLEPESTGQEPQFVSQSEARSEESLQPMEPGDEETLHQPIAQFEQVQPDGLPSSDTASYTAESPSLATAPVGQEQSDFVPLEAQFAREGLVEPPTSPIETQERTDPESTGLSPTQPDERTEIFAAASPEPDAVLAAQTFSEPASILAEEGQPETEEAQSAFTSDAAATAEPPLIPAPEPVSEQPVPEPSLIPAPEPVSAEARLEDLQEAFGDAVSAVDTGRGGRQPETPLEPGEYRDGLERVVEPLQQQLEVEGSPTGPDELVREQPVAQHLHDAPEPLTDLSQPSAEELPAETPVGRLASEEGYLPLEEQFAAEGGALPQMALPTQDEEETLPTAETESIAAQADGTPVAELPEEETPQLIPAAEPVSQQETEPSLIPAAEPVSEQQGAEPELIPAPEPVSEQQEPETQETEPPLIPAPEPISEQEEQEPEPPLVSEPEPVSAEARLEDLQEAFDDAVSAVDTGRGRRQPETPLEPGEYRDGLERVVEPLQQQLEDEDSPTGPDELVREQPVAQQHLHDAPEPIGEEQRDTAEPVVSESSAEESLAETSAVEPAADEEGYLPLEEQFAAEGGALPQMALTAQDEPETQPTATETEPGIAQADETPVAELPEEQAPQLIPAPEAISEREQQESETEPSLIPAPEPVSEQQEAEPELIPAPEPLSAEARLEDLQEAFDDAVSAVDTGRGGRQPETPLEPGEYRDGLERVVEPLQQQLEVEGSPTGPDELVREQPVAQHLHDAPEPIGEEPAGEVELHDAPQPLSEQQPTAEAPADEGYLPLEEQFAAADTAILPETTEQVPGEPQAPLELPQEPLDSQSEAETVAPETQPDGELPTPLSEVEPATQIEDFLPLEEQFAAEGGALPQMALPAQDEEETQPTAEVEPVLAQTDGTEGVEPSEGEVPQLLPADQPLAEQEAQEIEPSLIPAPEPVSEQQEEQEPEPVSAEARLEDLQEAFGDAVSAVDTGRGRRQPETPLEPGEYRDGLERVVEPLERQLEAEGSPTGPDELVQEQPIVLHDAPEPVGEEEPAGEVELHDAPQPLSEQQPTAEAPADEALAETPAVEPAVEEEGYLPLEEQFAAEGGALPQMALTAQDEPETQPTATETEPILAQADGTPVAELPEEQAPQLIPAAELVSEQQEAEPSLIPAPEPVSEQQEPEAQETEPSLIPAPEPVSEQQEAEPELIPAPEPLSAEARLEDLQEAFDDAVSAVDTGRGRRQPETPLEPGEYRDGLERVVEPLQQQLEVEDSPTGPDELVREQPVVLHDAPEPIGAEPPDDLPLRDAPQPLSEQPQPTTGEVGELPAGQEGFLPLEAHFASEAATPLGSVARLGEAGQLEGVDALGAAQQPQDTSLSALQNLSVISPLGPAAGLLDQASDTGTETAGYGALAPLTYAPGVDEAIVPGEGQQVSAGVPGTVDYGPTTVTAAESQPPVPELGLGEASFTPLGAEPLLPADIFADAGAISPTVAQDLSVLRPLTAEAASDLALGDSEVQAASLAQFSPLVLAAGAEGAISEETGGATGALGVEPVARAFAPGEEQALAPYPTDFEQAIAPVDFEPALPTTGVPGEDVPFLAAAAEFSPLVYSSSPSVPDTFAPTDAEVSPAVPGMPTLGPVGLLGAPEPLGLTDGILPLGMEAGESLGLDFEQLQAFGQSESLLGDTLPLAQETLAATQALAPLVFVGDGIEDPSLMAAGEGAADFAPLLMTGIDSGPLGFGGDTTGFAPDGADQPFGDMDGFDQLPESFDLAVVAGEPAAFSDAMSVPLQFASPFGGAMLDGDDGVATGSGAALQTPDSWSSIEHLMGEADAAPDDGGGGGGGGFSMGSDSDTGRAPIGGYMGDSMDAIESGDGELPPELESAGGPGTETPSGVDPSALAQQQLDDKMEEALDPADLETLAREVYSMLRHRIEIERERKEGFNYHGRGLW